MSWVRKEKLTRLEKFGLNVLKAGPPINHIAFIMDGNRRFAVNNNVKTAVGHSRGFEKLAQILQWSQYLGVNELTVYAFSIENFKRCPTEVEAFLNLTRRKFMALFEEKDDLNALGICVRIVGNTSLLPEDMQELVRKVAALTVNNIKLVLHIAFSYTSRDEITDSFNNVMDCVDNGGLLESDINVDTLSKCMLSGIQHEPDLLIRTSGELRLSDFLLWHLSSTVILFVNGMWPSFQFASFFLGIFYYQVNSNVTDKVKKYIKSL